MNKRFLLILLGLLVVVYSYDFFNRIYQPLNARDVNTEVTALVDVSLTDKVPDDIKLLLQQWGQLRDEEQMPDEASTDNFDTGTLGHLQLTLLAIYANQGQRTAVIVIQDNKSSEKHLVKLKKQDAWHEVRTIQLEAKTVTLELNNETITLRLFDAQSQRVQG